MTTPTPKQRLIEAVKEIKQDSQKMAKLGSHTKFWIKENLEAVEILIEEILE